MTSGVTCHHLLLTAHTVERRRVGHAIIAFGQHTQSKDVGRGMISHAFGQHTRSNDVGRDMPSPPLDSTHDRTTSGVACQHRLKASHTDERCRAWHDITAFGQHTQSNEVGHDMSSPPLDSTHGRMTSGVACHHLFWEAQMMERRRRGMPTSPLGSTHHRTTSGVACQHRLWAAQTVNRREALHEITALRLHA